MTLSSHVKRWLTGLTALPFLIFWLGWGSPYWVDHNLGGLFQFGVDHSGYHHH